jgi:cell division protein FtsI/penicillin-binding protein 2
MKLLNIILIFFAIYFIRRLLGLWRVMKQVQYEQARQEMERQNQEKSKAQEGDVVDAEYKVID